MTHKPPDRADAPVVLVVDDDRIVRMLCHETLSALGLRVEEAESGERALEIFPRTAPDLVLLDMVMPGSDGIETLMRLRRLPHGASTPVAMITGCNDAESIRRAYEAGATDFLTKPIQWMILAERVRYMLRASATARDLQENRALLVQAQRLSRLVSWTWDIERDVVTWSDEAANVFRGEAASIGSHMGWFLERVHPADRELVRMCIDSAVAQGTTFDLDHRLTALDGETLHVHVRAEVSRDESGRPAGVSGALQDISDRVRAEERIRTLAFYDTLTELPNATLFRRQLEQAIGMNGRDAGLMALVAVGLDRFTRINETLGRAFGDRVLTCAARRLESCVRTSGQRARGTPCGVPSFVSRLSGDEFMALITGLDGADEATAVAGRVNKVLANPLVVEPHEIHLTGSVGVSLFPADGMDPETLIKNAGAAMHHAKDLGGNTFQFYTASLHQKALERMELERDLRRALQNDELVLVYQPQMAVESGRIAGAEALIRWRHPRRGMISPAEFIPVAEVSGLIVPIGEWALRTACLQAETWRNELDRSLFVSVNVSSFQLPVSAFVERVGDLLHESGLPPDQLELEITESAIMSDLDETCDKLRLLKEMGVGLAIDDFGTGYSSLTYVKRFPIDVLKIDRSFVGDLNRNREDAAICSAIIAFGRGLGLEVVAEGVETEAQLAFLRDRGCDRVQGYLISRPLAAADFEELVRQSRRESTVRRAA
jgi:diguanylate cyclase (GGDEF)-like protein/PAS domain S-box-containing protein